MHEYALSQNLLDLICKEVSERHLSAPKAVTVKLGALLAVNQDALQLGFQLANSASELSAIQLNIDTIAGSAYCLTCKNSYELNNWYDACTHCASYDREIIAGEEFHLVNMELA